MEQTFHSFQTTTTNEEEISYLVDYSVESIIDAFIETRKELIGNISTVGEDVIFTIGSGKGSIQVKFYKNFCATPIIFNKPLFLLFSLTHSVIQTIGGFGKSLTKLTTSFWSFCPPVEDNAFCRTSMFSNSNSAIK